MQQHTSLSYLNNCQNTLIGNPPPANAPACEGFPDDSQDTETDFGTDTMKEEYRFNATQDCVLTRATYYDGQVKLCENSSDCANGDVCGKVGFCCYESAPDTEDTDAESPGFCRGTSEHDWFKSNCALNEDPAGSGCFTWNDPETCMTRQVCGKAEGEQAACFEQIENPRCEEIVDCNPKDELGMDTEHRSDPAELAPDPVDLASPEVFPHKIDDDLEEGDTETEIPDIDSDPCPGQRIGDQCSAGLTHKWCAYEPPTMPETIEQENMGKESKAESKDSSNRKTSGFDFDPNFDWIYDIKSGPLGIPKPNLGVSASVKATARMTNLFGDDSGETKQKDLINIALSLRLGLDPGTNLCGLTSKNEDGSDSVVEVLGIDFLPSSFKEYTEFPEPADQKLCIQKYGEFEDLVDRAKKAMKDAENLRGAFEATSGLSVPDVYGVTNSYYRPTGLGNVAAHIYPTKFFRMEFLGQLGNEGGLNTGAFRGAGILDFGFVKLKGGGEYKVQRSQNDGPEKRDERGVGGTVQFVIDKYVDFGVSGGWDIADHMDSKGNIDEQGSYITWSNGGFVNVLLVKDLLLGLGSNYTRLFDTKSHPENPEFARSLAPHMMTARVVMMVRPPLSVPLKTFVTTAMENCLVVVPESEAEAAAIPIMCVS
jgi:hypothetical protein